MDRIKLRIDATCIGYGDLFLGSSWDAANDRINFMIDLNGTDLLLSDTIALHWGFTCANDVIESTYSVPEPGMLWLLTIGLLGFGLRHQLKQTS